MSVLSAEDRAFFEKNGYVIVRDAVPQENLAARITKDNAAGLTVAPDDLEGFLAAAERLRASPEERARLAANARAYAEATFPIEKTANTFEEILATTR